MRNFMQAQQQTIDTNFEPECALPGTALTCLNSLKHGATSRMLFIPGENPQVFYNLLAESFKTHQPASTEDSALVTDLVLARWYLWRRQRSSNKSEFEQYTGHAEEDTLTPADLKTLALFDRYRTQAERTHARALKNVQTIKKNAFNEEKWSAQLELQKRKYDLDLQRFELRREQAVAKKKTSPTATPSPSDPAPEPDHPNPENFAGSSLPLRKTAVTHSVAVQNSDMPLHHGAAIHRLLFASASQNCS